MLQDEIRELVVRPALKLAGLWSLPAETLVYATGMVESNYLHLKQVGGPALSFWQLEPATHLDLKKYLNQHNTRALAERILSACFMSVLPSDEMLVGNMRYAALMCRLLYYRQPEELPKANDARGLAQYHKKYYNTYKGKADVDKNTEVFQKIINDYKSH